MAISKGEVSALVAAHAGWLSAFLRGLTRSEADAEDAFQEVWLRVLSVSGLKSFGSERAYLARVARSVVIDRFRRDRRLVCLVDKPGETGETMGEVLSDDSPAPGEVVERKSSHEEVLAAVRSLKAEIREVVLMRIEGELTFQEISDVTGVPLGTVLARMRQATDRLKRILRRK